MRSCFFIEPRECIFIEPLQLFPGRENQGNGGDVTEPVIPVQNPRRRQGKK